MKQILQNLSTGQSELVEAPAPRARKGQVLIDSTVSLISTGTERMLVDFGRAGVISKARQQPEKVRQVLDKVATDGLMTTVDAVRSKLAQPVPLGYCNVGVVRESGAEGFAPGDRVVSNGPHADVVSVPRNLCARIPEGVSDEAAAFVVVASIGLQGIRLAQPTLGESFVVTGVGLIGLLTVQMLRAQGCRVLAVDFDAGKLALARRFGAQVCNPAAGEDPVAAGLAFSRGVGVDGVIVTASTKSSDPITQAARMCRKRGRIVLVGVTGLELNRADFYEKELSFQVSCSYGPGRYDPAYEEGGQDYPIGFVRWTEQRNFQAVLDLLASGALNVGPLISHRVAFEEAPRAYELLSRDKSAWHACGAACARPGDCRGQAGGGVYRGWQLCFADADPGLQGGGGAAAHDRLGGGHQCGAARAHGRICDGNVGYRRADRRPRDQHRRHRDPPQQPRAPDRAGAARGQACVRGKAAGA
jgi:threonine dehydrogenase-like Zn-dependent dehydrogenase